jgi:hypothetical protein
MKHGKFSAVYIIGSTLDLCSRSVQFEAWVDSCYLMDLLTFFLPIVSPLDDGNGSLIYAMTLNKQPFY